MLARCHSETVFFKGKTPICKTRKTFEMSQNIMLDASESNES